MKAYWLGAALLLCLCLVMAAEGRADDDDPYRLTPVEITPGVWVVEGARENFSRHNGGNIVNTAFVDTGEGVVVIDTGPSRLYGEALRATIAAVTERPVTHVLITHHHPDHAFGNQAFPPATLHALEGTIERLAAQGEGFADNLYRLVGSRMQGTEIVLPERVLSPGEMSIGDHRFELLEMTGHTGADLVVLDRTSGVLFASDMVFHERALTTPQTPGLQRWKDELEVLEALDFTYLVPGHGPVSTGKAAFAQMRDYLTWLDETLRESANEGLTTSEVMSLPIPERFRDVAMAEYELIRTTTHLYPAYERAALAP